MPSENEPENNTNEPDFDITEPNLHYVTEDVDSNSIHIGKFIDDTDD